MKGRKLAVAVVMMFVVLMSGTGEASAAEYWQGEPMNFAWAMFSPLNELQLFTVAEENDAGGFIYGMWVTPGFVLFRHSETDAQGANGWEVDWGAEDDRIRPKLSTEKEKQLFQESGNLYAQIMEEDRLIDEYLTTICEDLDDIWWFKLSNVGGKRDGVFKRQEAMIRGLTDDIERLEAAIQEELTARNKLYDLAVATLRGELEDLGDALTGEFSETPVPEPEPEVMLVPRVDECPVEDPVPEPVPEDELICYAEVLECVCEALQSCAECIR
ncbi:hypothetical protein IJI72_00490 [Candidatus Saccharibacteria bacterium]|nr:hypothetical protein [Candidatus Saccharibacteria bacterium]